MSKFVFYTDIHFAGKPPRHRIDDFTEALLNKLRETYEVAEKNNCDFVLFGGDMFNSHKVFSFDMIGDIMDVIGKSKLKTYCIVGQHDINGYNPETIKSSSLSMLIRHCKNFKVIKDPLILGDFYIAASHVWDNVLEVAAIKPTVEGKVKVLMSHSLLSDKMHAFEVIKTDKVGENYDLVLSGDLHTGFDTHTIGKTTFCNPGSMARRRIDEIDKVPKILLIEGKFGQPLDIQEIVLKSVKSGKDVFGRTAIEEIRDKAKFNPESFSTVINKARETAIDTADFIKIEANNRGVRKEVVSYLINKIETKNEK